MSERGFSGSYLPEDVTFLLKRVELAPTEIAEKERLIQSGQRHYSEMLSAEERPDDAYLALFEHALAVNRERFAADVARLARMLDVRHKGEIVLVSLARAGTPVGVLLRRALLHLGRRAVHYSVSIVRDRGIDWVALDYVLGRHRAQDVVFVDGWTAKGAIAAELCSSVTAYNAARGAELDPGLVVVADLAGMATLAATDDDYVIPCSILNAVVSGLVSRTVLNVDVVGAGDFHACVYYRALEPYDVSRRFVDDLSHAVERALDDPAVTPIEWDAARRSRLAAISERFVNACLVRYRLVDRNRVKPGIGEASRALLRRLPERLIVREPGAVDVGHLEHLAGARRLTVEHDPGLPYRAAAIIQTLGKG